MEEYYQAAMLDPDDESLILEVSRRLLQNKQPEKALEVATRAAARPNASGRIYARLGLIYAQLGKPGQAAAANRMAIKKSPDSLLGYQNLLKVICKTSSRPRRSKCSIKPPGSRIRTPSSSSAWRRLYTSTVRRCRRKEPAPRQSPGPIEPGRETGSRHSAAAPETGGRFQVAGRFGQSRATLPRGAQTSPRLAARRGSDPGYLTALYLRRCDREAGHRAAPEALLRDDPTNPQVHYYLGRLALEDKKLAEAADHFSKTVLLRPDLNPPITLWPWRKLEQNKVSEALATLDKARQKFSPELRVGVLHGAGFDRQKAYAEALKHFVAAEVIAKATDPEPAQRGFLFRVGATCERKGDYDQAESILTSAWRFAPDFAEAQNYLGYMWAEHGLKLEKARELIAKAVKAEPKNAAYLDSMAWVLLQVEPAGGGAALRPQGRRAVRAARRHGG